MKISDLLKNLPEKKKQSCISVGGSPHFNNHDDVNQCHSLFMKELSKEIEVDEKAVCKILCCEENELEMDWGKSVAKALASCPEKWIKVKG